MIDTDVKKITLSSDVTEALAQASEIFESALRVLPPVRPDVPVDQMEDGPVPTAPGDDSPSSVQQRERPGKGMAAHEVRGGGGDDGGELPGSCADGLDDFFLPGGGFTSIPVSIAGGQSSSYLDRRLLAYYLSGMAEHHHVLDTLNFYRGEEHWDGRYNFDHENRVDGVVREQWEDDDYYRRASLDDASDRVAAEIRMTEDMFSSDDWSRQQALDDFHRYNSR